MAGKFVSRRSLFAWCAAVSLGGCAEDQATKIAKDPYLPTMMKDPLYTWKPTGDLARTESLLPKSTDNFASGTAVSRIVIEFRFRASGDAQGLLQEAQRISSEAGYVNGDRILMPGVDVLCTIGELNDKTGVGILLLAPG